jgi:glycolate oxidase FAD binding subunit
MLAPLKPATEEELRDMIAECVETKIPLAPVGFGTKSGIGRPVNHLALDLTALSGVVAYEPDELVLTVRAGTPVDDVVALLADHGQELPFEPPMWTRPDASPSRGTIGGLVMTNFSGPRRLKVGAVRDHVLGLKGVSGRAEMFKAGGRVVKNVTGYDLARGLCGSWGMLAIATEVTFKILPKAETEATLVVHGLAPAAAVALMTDAMQEPADVSSAAYLPEDIATEITTLTRAATLLRLEGFGPSVSARIFSLTKRIARHGAVDVLEEATSRPLWQAVRDVSVCVKAPHAGLWRVSIAPADAARLTDAIAEKLSCRFAYDWSGGLVWIWVNDDLLDLGASIIRLAIAATGGGHATLMYGPADKRAAIDVFQPQPPALAALNARLKSQFDPMGILNPGRMVREA